MRTSVEPSGDVDLRSDADLLADHVDGDPLAFGLLLSRHQDRLWAVALRTMGSPEDAADALQDALISAFRRAGSFRGDSQVTTWLHRIVVNACLDRIRHNKVRLSYPLPDDPDRAAHLAEENVGMDPVEHAALRDDITRALAVLNTDQRAALVLVDMEGYSVEEAAEILGCAPGTIKSRCSRGRARLAPLLIEHQLNGTAASAGTSQNGTSGRARTSNHSEATP